MANPKKFLDMVVLPLGKRETRRFFNANKGFVGPVANVRPRDMTKEEQLQTILKTNPMRDDYHYGTRTIDDVHTLQEVVDHIDEVNAGKGWSRNGYPDIDDSVYDDALESGWIDVYSSKPIVNGNFVAVSPMMAQEYGSMNRPPNYHKRLRIGEVSWLDPEQGQVAMFPDQLEQQIKSKEKEWKRLGREMKRSCSGMFFNSPGCKTLLDKYIDMGTVIRNMEEARRNRRF